MHRLQLNFLSFDDCPNKAIARQNIQKALADEGMHGEIIDIDVPDFETAQAAQFLDSPSVRIDGLDVERNTSQIFRLMCRIYSDKGNIVGAPPVARIRDTLQKWRSLRSLNDSR